MQKKADKSFSKFLILCFGSFIAAVGSGMTSFGLGIYVFQQTGLTSATTLITLLAFLPGLLLTPLAGVLADRYDRRLLMILGDGLSALGLVYMLICMQSGGAQLWQIGIGVTVSSIFSSLIEPSFRATVTDLLAKEQYSKASGLVQLIGSARYLISPLVAGLLLAVADIKLLLIIDICTIAVTVCATVIVRKGLSAKHSEQRESIMREFKTGWSALTQNRGVFVLTLTGIAISFFLGCIQSMSAPMMLGFTDSKTIGITTTISALGMLVSSLILGTVSIKKGFGRMMSVSLFMAGLFMAGFGSRENLIVVCLSGFLFFAMLPFANASIDYLIRTNISNETQGRVWGLIGIISQFGFIIAYSLVGPLADNVFIPLLKEGGALADNVGKVIGVGSSRGIGFLIILSGLLLAVTAVLLFTAKSVRKLEDAK